jgi:hypothetical protein
MVGAARFGGKDEKCLQSFPYRARRSTNGQSIAKLLAPIELR